MGYHWAARHGGLVIRQKWEQWLGLFSLLSTRVCGSPFQGRSSFHHQPLPLGLVLYCEVQIPGAECVLFGPESNVPFRFIETGLQTRIPQLVPRNDCVITSHGVGIFRHREQPAPHSTLQVMPLPLRPPLSGLHLQPLRWLQAGSLVDPGLSWSELRSQWEDP